MSRIQRSDEAEQHDHSGGPTGKDPAFERYELAEEILNPVKHASTTEDVVNGPTR